MDIVSRLLGYLYPLSSLQGLVWVSVTGAHLEGRGKDSNGPTPTSNWSRDD